MSCTDDQDFRNWLARVRYLLGDAIAEGMVTVDVEYAQELYEDGLTDERAADRMMEGGGW